MKTRIIALLSSLVVVTGSAVAAAPAASAGAFCSFGGYGHTTTYAYTTGIIDCITVQARAGYRTGSASTTWTAWYYKLGNTTVVAPASNVLNGGHRVEHSYGEYWTASS